MAQFIHNCMNFETISYHFVCSISRHISPHQNVVSEISAHGLVMRASRLPARPLRRQTCCRLRPDSHSDILVVFIFHAAGYAAPASRMIVDLWGRGKKDTSPAAREHRRGCAEGGRKTGCSTFHLHRRHPMASVPVSPVLMRMHSSSGMMNIFPSPMSPVRAPLMMASTVGLT